MPAFAISTRPKSASCNGPTTRMIASIAPRIALNRVNTLARTIWPTVRVGAAGTSLTCPRATRSSTSAAVSPRSGSAWGASAVTVALMSAERSGATLERCEGF